MKKKQSTWEGHVPVVLKAADHCSSREIAYSENRSINRVISRRSGSSQGWQCETQPRELSQTNGEPQAQFGMLNSIAMEKV
jgi:hypothetical protein